MRAWVLSYTRDVSHTIAATVTCYLFEASRSISPFMALSRYGAENGWLGSLAHSVSASGHLRARADQIGAALKTNGPLSERAGGVTV
jgi:hypothetical protein